MRIVPRAQWNMEFHVVIVLKFGSSNNIILKLVLTETCCHSTVHVLVINLIKYIAGFKILADNIVAASLLTYLVFTLIGEKYWFFNRKYNMCCFDQRISAWY